MTFATGLRRLSLVLALGAVLGVTGPAHAKGEADIYCAFNNAPEEMHAAVGDIIEADYPGGSLLGDYQEEFSQIVDDCAAQLGLDRALYVDYFSFSVNLVTQGETRRRLVEMGLPMDELDAVIGVARGNVSPRADGLDDDQRNAVVQLILGAEISLQESRRLGGLLGPYLIASSLLEETRPLLGS